MNAREYIESGILELYVMGSLSFEEMLEVKKIVETQPEIMQEFIRIENVLLSYLYANAVEPKPELRARIANAVELEARESEISNSTGISSKITSIHRQTPVLNYFSAACIALLMLSAIGNFSLWNKLRTAESEIYVLNANKEELAQQFNTVKNSYKQSLSDISVFRNTAFKLIVMKGLPAMDSTALAKVYWNKNTEEAFLDISKLPLPVTGKQYQLWALVDGKPLDAGVFTVGGTSLGLQKMKSVINAQAFAVTLEPFGGSAAPTLSALYVIGNV